MRRAAIAYKIEFKNGKGIEDQPSFSIAYGWVWEEGEEDKITIGEPKRWKVTFPTIPEGQQRKPLGASETMGFLGGISDPLMAKKSEIFERVVGDALTVSLCFIIDNLPNSKQELEIFTLGPAMPKVIGRFASLRIPQHVRIFWIAPKSPPKGLESYIPPWVIPSYPSYDHTYNYERDHEYPEYLEPWEDDSLVQGVELEKSGTTLVIQAFRPWGDVVFNPDEWKWREPEAKELESIILPKELSLACDVLYEGVEEVEYITTILEKRERTGEVWHTYSAEWKSSSSVAEFA